MSRQLAYMCKTPREHCSGASPTQEVPHAYHGSREEAFRCTVRYYKQVLGYEQISPREFRTPRGILVMDKVSKFGGLVRRGKEGRFMQDRKHGVVW